MRVVHELSLSTESGCWVSAMRFFANCEFWVQEKRDEVGYTLFFFFPERRGWQKGGGSLEAEPNERVNLLWNRCWARKCRAFFCFYLL